MGINVVIWKDWSTKFWWAQLNVIFKAQFECKCPLFCNLARHNEKLSEVHHQGSSWQKKLADQRQWLWPRFTRSSGLGGKGKSLKICLKLVRMWGLYTLWTSGNAEPWVKHFSWTAGGGGMPVAWDSLKPSAERITMYTVQLNTKTMSSAWSVFLSNLETSQVSPLNKNTI